jgi:hypothetical protein
MFMHAPLAPRSSVVRAKMIFSRSLALLAVMALGSTSAQARCSDDDVRCLPPLRVLHEDGVVVPFSDGSAPTGSPAPETDSARLVPHAEIAPFAARAASSMRSCAVIAERSSAAASGDVTLSWRIVDGLARSPTIVADTTGLPDVAACVAERLDGARMPRESGGFVVRYVWRLAREER